jgi:hypothetical protein
MSTETARTARVSNILPFPAKTCSYFVRGRCCLPTGEQDPAEEPQCEVLSVWERLQDRALDMAEECCLDASRTLELVAGTLEQAQDLDLLCAGYRPGGNDPALDCIFFHGHLCMHCLPLCAGMCRHFQTRNH